MGKRFLEAGQAKDVGGHGGLAFIVLAYPSAESYNSTAREGTRQHLQQAEGTPQKQAMLLYEVSWVLIALMRNLPGKVFSFRLQI